MPQSFEEPSLPVFAAMTNKAKWDLFSSQISASLYTNTQNDNTDLLKEHRFSAGAVFAHVTHAMVLPCYFRFLLQWCKEMLTVGGPHMNMGCTTNTI